MLFNVGDLFQKGRALLLLSLLRFLLLPLIFFCNVHPRFHSTTLFHSDTIFVILISLLAVSNGLLFTSANVSATRKVDEDLRELTGSLMGLIAVISSVIGSIFGALIALSV
ncbi:unnamed protein product [Anisakis simplex]|uniref:Uncharacterized protein n=1 Tax=Anisakis simplex TaxID=6269 RepID=A0A3P6NA77_ANISI|nr:unnamed protein product [Anisakis simplex]